METNLKYINLICTDLGGVGGHFTNLSGENEICTLLGGSGGHFTEVAALNEICTIQGVTAGHSLNLAALSAIGATAYKTNLEAWKNIQEGTTLNPFPLPSLQSFTSDLTVIDKSGSKYFKALKGDDLLITNCDFTGKGWPVKSIATIDIFGQTGVPVVSLLSGNFDLLNQYFTKITAGTYDVDGIELTPAYISAIVAYSAALTGADLTAANSYFAPETESTYFLDLTSGNDANNGTTKALANKTFTGMEADIASGTVNILTGNATDTAIASSKAIEWIGRGKSLVKSEATANGVIRSANSASIRKFKHLIIDGQTVNGFLGVQATSSNITFDKCYFINCKTGNIGLGTYGIATTNLKILNSIVNSATYLNVIYGVFTEILNNLFSGTSTDNYITTGGRCMSKNNYFVVSVAAGKFIIYQYTTGEIVNNYMSNAGIGGILYDTAGATVTKFNKNIVRQANTNSALSNYYILIRGSASECSDNDILLTGTSTAGNDNKTYLVLISGSTTPKVENNTIETYAAGYLSHIEIESLTTVCGAAKINNNTIRCRAAINSALIGIDVEKAAAQHNHFNGFEMNDNVCYAPAYYGNGYGTMHGLFAWGNNGNMLRNYVNGAWIGCLMKGADLTVTFSMSYNKLINCGASLYIKGVTGAEVSHNIVDTNCAVSSSNAVVITRNVALKAQSTNIHHNELTYRGSLSSFSLIYIENADCLTGFTSDYNTFYTTQAHVATVGSTNYTFAEWQALGYDLHSTLLSVAPAFDESETLPV